MSNIEMVRSYTETLLERLLGTDKVIADQDGDYPVRFNSALYFVRVDVDRDERPVVQVFAIAVEELEASPELFEALNEVNRSLHFARAFWVRGQVLIEADLIGEGLSPAVFGSACDDVAGATDYFGPRLAEQFGGRTAFADEKEDAPAEDPGPRDGMYL